MAIIKVKNKLVKAELVIFDKDGTLVDFCYAWERIARARTKIMVGQMGIAPSLAREILRSFGVDPDNDFVDPRGPLAQASQEDEVIIAASILYREGYPWDEARQIAEKSFKKAEALYTLSQLTRPVPGVNLLLEKLKKAGVKTAVATIDNYHRTLKILDLIGAGDFFDFVVSREDVKNTKPHPEMIHIICQNLGISPKKAVMVGDAVNDMIMGKKAQVALTVGILNGINSPESFSGWADVIIESLLQIKVNSEEE